MTDVPTRVVTVKAQGEPKVLVVFLHGVGANADDLAPIAREWARSLPDADQILPDAPEPFDGGGDGRQWFSLAGVADANRANRIREAASNVSPWIDRQLALRHLPPGHLVLVGFSQGAMLAEWLAVHRRPQPLAVVAFSGRFADDAPAQGASVSTPVLIVHGTADPRIPVAAASDAQRELALRGAVVETLIEPGLGHGISDAGAERALAFVRAHVPSR